MDTHQFVLNIFLIYIFIKALVLCPLGWMTLCVWWNDRQEAKRVLKPAHAVREKRKDLVILTPRSDAA